MWKLVRELRADGVTVLLVTHSMDEAQQLCDRIAIIDAGRVRALDTPDRFIRSAGAATTTSFTASAAVNLEDLRGFAGISAVRADAGRIVVEGDDGAAAAVLDRLRQHGVTASGLRVVDSSLDTAYLELTSTPEETSA